MARAPKSHALGATLYGFFFGLFLSLFLVFVGAIRLDSWIVTLLPILFLLLGLGLGLAGRTRVLRLEAASAPPTIASEEPAVDAPPAGT
ncbi:MAG TPA: hypothetical protein VF855_03970 [Acidimicrobiales bacterium]